MNIPEKQPQDGTDLTRSIGDGALDPDPYVISVLILSAIATAANVYSAYNSASDNHEKKKRRNDVRQARLLRWDADLHELRSIVMELQDFLGELGAFTDSRIPKPLKPLTGSLLLDDKEFRKCRSILGRLINMAHQINNSSFGLIEILQNTQLQEFLSANVAALQEELMTLGQMHSLESSFATAGSILELLIRTAEYARNNMI